MIRVDEYGGRLIHRHPGCPNLSCHWGAHVSISRPREHVHDIEDLEWQAETEVIRGYALTDPTSPLHS
jgi:hypothetical protein